MSETLVVMTMTDESGSWDYGCEISGYDDWREIRCGDEVIRWNAGRVSIVPFGPRPSPKETGGG